MKSSLRNLTNKLTGRMRRLRRYAVLLFLLLLAGVYGFLFMRINSLNNIAAADATTASSQVNTAATPHIDQKVVKQLRELQDNSVSVKSLFDQARSNPFQE